MHNTDEIRAEYAVMKQSLQEAVDGSRSHVELRVYDLLKHFEHRLDALLEENTQGSGETTQGWRKVGEALPEEGEEVRIHYEWYQAGGSPETYGSTGSGTEVVFFHDGKWIADQGQSLHRQFPDFYDVTVTHFHRLPAPPSTDDHEDEE